MSGQSFISNTKAGTAGGTLTILLANLSVTDLVHTAILASVGATVSFIVSLLWKHIFRKWFK